MHNARTFAAYFGLTDLEISEDMMIFNIQKELNVTFKLMSSLIEIY